MTREEEITEKSKEFLPDILDDEYPYKAEFVFGFQKGAKWADNNPKEGLVSIDKVCEYLEMRIDDYIIQDLRKAMEI